MGEGLCWRNEAGVIRCDKGRERRCDEGGVVMGERMCGVLGMCSVGRQHEEFVVVRAF